MKQRAAILAAFVALILGLATGCSSDKDRPAVPDTPVCQALNANQVPSQLAPVIGRVAEGTATPADLATIKQAATDLRAMAGQANGPLKSTLDTAAGTLDQLTDDKGSVAEIEAVAAAFMALGKEAGEACHLPAQ